MKTKSRAIRILIPMLLLMIGMFNITPAKASYVYDATLAQSSPLNNGFDNGYRWIHYGNILVQWEYFSGDRIIGHGKFINERDDSYTWSFDFTFLIPDVGSLSGKARLGADSNGDDKEDFIIESDTFTSWSGSYSETAGGTSVHFVGTANWNGVSGTPFDIGFNDIQNSDGTWAYITIKGTVAVREYEIWTNDNIDQSEIVVDEDVSGYQYTWEEDRDLDGNTMEGWVTVDYGPFGGLVSKYESGTFDFGFEETSKAQYGGKVIHLSMSWVPGVTVPGEENKFIIKYDGTEAYVGGFQTPLFWDYFTIQGDPPGSYLIMNKFYFVELVDTDGYVNGGFYVEYQYFTIPDE